MRILVQEQSGKASSGLIQLRSGTGAVFLVYELPIWYRSGLIHERSGTGATCILYLKETHLVRVEVEELLLGPLSLLPVLPPQHLQLRAQDLLVFTCVKCAMCTRV